MTVVNEKGLVAFGDPIDEPSLNQLKEVLMHPEAVKGALMADHHKGYSIPIGGVVAFQDAISPNGVGYDIACGNMAVRTNISLADVLADAGLDVAPHPSVIATEDVQIAAIKPLMREIQRRVEFGMGGESVTKVDHPVLDLGQNVWLDIVNAFGADLHKKAVAQLGTVGSGNHYVDLLVDEFGYVWIANHFGSRGLGHTLCSGFLSQHYGLGWKERVSDDEANTPVIFSTDSDIGQFYVEAMQLAGRYAYAGREHVTDQVLKILGAEVTFSVHNHHNFAWHENGLWVVRKGATPLTEEFAFIGGSMGDDSYIVHGVALEEEGGFMMPDGELYTDLYNRVIDLGNIGSAPHGAGRVMSRTQAAGKRRYVWSCNNRDCDWEVRKLSAQHVESGDVTDGIDGLVGRPTECPQCGGHNFTKIQGRDKSTAAIDWDTERSALVARGITVLGAGADEAPGVYKRLDQVLAQHLNIEIAHRLSPIGVVMAGPDTFDPYKD